MQQVDEYRVSVDEFKAAAKNLALCDMNEENTSSHLWVKGDGILSLVGREMKPADVAKSMLDARGLDLPDCCIEVRAIGGGIALPDGKMRAEGDVLIRVCTDV